LRPKLDTCETMADVRVLLAEMIHRLGLSHFEILPGEILSTMDIPDNPVDQAGVTGMVVRVVGGAALVARVRPETPAAEAGIRPGWEVVTAGGDKVTEVLAPLQEQYADHIRYPIYAATAVLNRLAGKVGDTVTATFRDSSGNLVTDSLVLAERVGQRTVFGNLPPFYLTIDTATLEGGIGYFAFNCFFDPGMLMGRFQEFVAAHRDAPGWIIDVRGNPGGIGGIAMGLAGFMVSEKNLLIGTLTTRESNLKMVINPRAETYDGRVAVLIDGLSGSSAEFFSGGLQAIGRARVFGSRSMGAALSAMTEKLANGDALLYVFADFLSADGTRLEGTGVTPDEPVELTRESLLAGRDRVIEAAADWIRQQEK
ncbi:MAG TPA: S41 family peptidase, partial [candidate division Zixibacteria bacterium]|nr:S41 family peptidase [candidate division Zixibacteria bacterium]